MPVLGGEITLGSVTEAMGILIDIPFGVKVTIGCDLDGAGCNEVVVSWDGFLVSLLFCTTRCLRVAVSWAMVGVTSDSGFDKIGVILLSVEGLEGSRVASTFID